MTLYQIKDGQPVTWNRKDRVIGPDGDEVSIQPNVEQVWDAELLAQYGLFKPLPPEPVGEGRVVVSSEVTLNDGGVPQIVRTTEAITVSPEGIKAEAHRRILEIAPEWKQRNLNAQATALLQARIINGVWTAEEQALSDSLNAVWDRVSAIRAASNQLEAMDPIPLDFTADKHWP